jgi:hypothetical protein
MNKALLVSVVFALVAIPTHLARERHPVRALRKVFIYTLAFNVCYALALRFVLPRL